MSSTTKKCSRINEIKIPREKHLNVQRPTSDEIYREKSFKNWKFQEFHESGIRIDCTDSLIEIRKHSSSKRQKSLQKRFTLCFNFQFETLDYCFHFRFKWMRLRWKLSPKSRLWWNKTVTMTKKFGRQLLIVN
jgi:hypothetical protein